jgi:flap endonuclease-1
VESVELVRDADAEVGLMGVDLGSLVSAQETSMQALKGRTIAVDAHNTLYQFVSIIRQPDGTPLKDHEGRVTSHLSGILHRGGNMVAAGLDPVFVFDGKPHELKSATVQERKARKEKAQQDYEEALAEGDMERARAKASQTSRLDKPMIEQAKRLILALGMGYVEAPEEGEAQAARMVREGQAYAVASQDFDALLFGAPRLVRNLTVTGRRKLPRKQVWVDVMPEELVLEDVEAQLGVSREALVDLALLLGTDYNPGVKGVGPKKALALIQEHGDLEGIQRALQEGSIKPESALARQLREGWEELGDLQEMRALFLSPGTTGDVEVLRGRLDSEQVVQVLVEEHAFQEGRVRSALERYESAKEAKKQRSLDTFF